MGRLAALSLAAAAMATFAGGVDPRASALSAAAQYPDRVKDDDFRKAIQFYTEGGWFCLRLAPVEEADKQTEWTVVVLSSRALKATTFWLGDSGLWRARFVKTAPLKPNARVQVTNAVDLKGSELLALRKLEQAR